MSPKCPNKASRTTSEGTGLSNPFRWESWCLPRCREGPCFLASCGVRSRWMKSQRSRLEESGWSFGWFRSEKFKAETYFWARSATCNYYDINNPVHSLASESPARGSIERLISKDTQDILEGFEQGKYSNYHWLSKPVKFSFEMDIYIYTYMTRLQHDSKLAK